MKPNAFLLKSALAAALGGILFGFDMGAIAGATRGLTTLYHLTATGLGITVSAALIGAIPGAMFAGMLGDRIGRRDGLRVLALLYLIAALGSAFSPDWYSLLAFRFVCGASIGASSVLCPMYIAEISPPQWRGFLGSFFEVDVVIGLLLGYSSNYLIGTLHSGDIEWRLKLGIVAAPAVVFLATLFRIPRSPRWLAPRGMIDEARDVLRATGQEDYEDELRRIVEAHSDSGEPLFTRKYAFPIFLAVSIALFNQLSGINPMWYYLDDIFARAGFSEVSSNVQAIVIAAIDVVFTVLAMLVIDRVGRRFLLLTGAVGTAVCLAGVSAIFFTNRHTELLIWLLGGFIAFFAFSQGTVIWVYFAEIFPTSVRGKGQSLGSFTHWVANALISGLFPLMAATSGGLPFAFFTAITVVQFFVVMAIYPETKGVPLEELHKRLRIG